MDDISALLGFGPVRLAVRDNHELGTVEIAVASDDAPLALLLSPAAALDLSLRVLEAAARIHKARHVAAPFDHED